MTHVDKEYPVHILLVEDEPDLRDTMRYNLKRHGYVVTDVGNGQQALAVLHGVGADNGAIDVVVSDVMMPVLDGIGMARAMRAGS